MRSGFVVIAAFVAGVSIACDRAGSADEQLAADGVAAPGAPAGTTAEPVRAVDSWREVVIPAGTVVPLVLETPVASDTSRLEEPVRARVAREVTIDGATVIAEGSAVTGVVTQVTRSGKVKGRAQLAIEFDTLRPHGEDTVQYELNAATVARRAEATKKDDALKIGAPAAGGAIIGGIVGGKKGALIGTAAGGGAGTAVVLATRGQEVRLAKGAAINLRLAEPLTVRVRR